MSVDRCIEMESICHKKKRKSQGHDCKPKGFAVIGRGGGVVLAVDGPQPEVHGDTKKEGDGEAHQDRPPLPHHDALSSPSYLSFSLNRL